MPRREARAAQSTDAQSTDGAVARATPRLFVAGGMSDVVCARRGETLACSQRVPLPAGAVGVAMSTMHACAWTGDGKAFCGGYNKDGRLGLGTKTDSEAMSPVPGLARVTRMALTARSSCAITSDGAAWCWGDDRSAAPARVVGVGRAVDVSAGQEPRCFLQDDGAVVRWAFDTPGAVSFAPLSSVASLGGCQPTAVCGARKDGTAACASTGEFPGRIAIFSNDLASLHQVVQVASDAELGCALRADKTVACWGGSKARADGAPVAIAELTDVREIAGGNRQVCALRGDGDGEVWCVSDDEPTKARKIDLR